MVKGIKSFFMGYLMHFHAFAQPLDSKLPLAFGPQLLGLSFPFVWTFCWEKPDANRLPLPHNLRIPTKTGVSLVKSTAPLENRVACASVFRLKLYLNTKFNFLFRNSGKEITNSKMALHFSAQQVSKKSKHPVFLLIGRLYSISINNGLIWLVRVTVYICTYLHIYV